MTESITAQDYARAERDVLMHDARRDFRYHALLIAYNLLVIPEYLWFYFPLVGWGVGLLMHYYFGVRQSGQMVSDLQARVEMRAREYAAR